jgi:hypothetical protein
MASSPLASGRPRILRRRPAEQEEEIIEHAQTTGKIVWEWNALHSKLFLIFWFLLIEAPRGASPSEQSRRKALALWHTIQSDDLQRKMLLAIIETDKTSNPVNNRLRWILKMADAMAPFRNILVHVPIDFEYDDEDGLEIPMPDVLSSRQNAYFRHLYSNLVSPKFWTTLGDDLLCLMTYTDYIVDYLMTITEPFPMAS